MGKKGKAKRGETTLGQQFAAALGDEWAEVEAEAPPPDAAESDAEQGDKKPSDRPDRAAD